MTVQHSRSRNVPVPGDGKRFGGTELLQHALGNVPDDLKAQQPARTTAGRAIQGLLRAGIAPARRRRIVSAERIAKVTPFPLWIAGPSLSCARQCIGRRLSAAQP